MRIHVNLLFLLFFVICIIGACGRSGPVTVSSPNGSVVVTFTEKGGADSDALRYGVTFNGIPIVLDSPLGLMLANGMNLGRGMTVNAVTTGTMDEVYPLRAGKSSEAHNHYNEAAILLEDSEERAFQVTFRAFDDGVAYRYEFPEPRGDLLIMDDLSSFNFVDDHTFWGLTRPNFTTSHEGPYTNDMISTIHPDSLLDVPFLVQVADSAWTAITEAHLEDYAGMYLVHPEGNLMKATLSPLPDEPDLLVRTEGPRTTPWRVLMIGKNPGVLAESNIILNLNPPPDFDTSWVRAGKSAWNWWNGNVIENADFQGGMDNRTMQYFIDFAGGMGFEYMLIDAGWSAGGSIMETNPDIDMPMLVEYAAERDVGLWIWLYWTAADEQQEEAFPLYHEWGIRGVKIDFMDRDDQEMVNFYHRTARTAAENQLMIDFHGAFKPTGLRRTFPNVMTREGIMGLEYNKWSEELTPEHDCIIPFTRQLAGPMDYTPGGFTNATREQFVPRQRAPMVQGTRAHTLAKFVIIESPFQCVSDYPDNYRNNPAGTQLLRDVPATWDETRVPQAAVGDYVVFARRSGEDWYLGAFTDWDARTLSQPLSFLGEGDYVAEIYADGPDAATDATDLAISRALVTADTAMNIDMAPGGGIAARFSPAPMGSDLPRYRE